MDKNELKGNLRKIIDDYADRIRSSFAELSDEPATHGDLCELGRQTFYTFDEMCVEIIKYLDTN